MSSWQSEFHSFELGGVTENNYVFRSFLCKKGVGVGLYLTITA